MKSCVIWDGPIDRHGYGRRGRSRAAHRVYWEIAYGEIPDGMCVCHRCDNRACVEPTHLFLGTNQDNVDDRESKGRGTYGGRNGRTKLTESDVLKIRKANSLGFSHAQLAEEYRVSKSQIQRITSRQHWTHI